MNFILNVLKSIVFGVIQGITEWLPISSTGHLILAESFMPLKLFNDVNQNQAFFNMYKVVIQFGSILAVLLLYWNKLYPFRKSYSEKKKRSIYRTWILVIIATIPAGIAGVLLDDLIDSVLSTPVVIALALIVYGVLFIWMESQSREYAIESIRDITPKKALGVGCFQILALIPGTSRSGSTILGSTLLGFNRSTAAEFSFFMAIPVMFGASLLKIIKAEFTVTFEGVVVLLVGMITAFVVSVIVIKKLMQYIRKHDFKVFGYYRIILGIVVLLLSLFGFIA